jgi:hypothetical protein
MAFELADISYDAQARRAYVTLRETDEDGEEIVASITFAHQPPTPLPFAQIQKEIARKTGQILLQAGVELSRD